ncbi:MAG: hypothetical protein HOY76_28765, partial [Streptomyces sp.]|nr:hypothetical protein [Streptomyces sp.]
MTDHRPAPEARQTPGTPPWPPALVPADRPRRPGTAPRCSAVESADLDSRSVREPVLAAAFAAVLHRCTGQERIALATADGELRFQVTGESTLRDLAAHLPTSGEPRAEEHT